MTNKDHLWWIYNRLINVYGENANYDYMLRFRNIIETAAVNELNETDYRRLYTKERSQRHKAITLLEIYEEISDMALTWYNDNFGSEEVPPDWVDMMREQLEAMTDEEL